MGTPESQSIDEDLNSQGEHFEFMKWEHEKLNEKSEVICALQEEAIIDSVLTGCMFFKNII